MYAIRSYYGHRPVRDAPDPGAIERGVERADVAVAEVELVSRRIGQGGQNRFDDAERTVAAARELV